MSRIGKKPVALPKGVTASVEGQTVKVKGPKGELKVTLVPEVSVSMEDGGVVVAPREEMENARAMSGLSRTLVNNLVVGVTEGFTSKLEIQGVGYRTAVQGKNLNLQLGFSHDVVYPIPAGIKVSLDAKANRLTVSGIDRQQVGQVAAEIRGLRKPDPYKQKGIRYVGEVLKKKAGKAGATGAK